jgi:tetratricopeptide (TPR) repeat protein
MTRLKKQRFVMSKSFVPAALAVFALALSSVPATLHAASVSPASAKALKAVQDADGAKRYAEVLTRAEEALRVSGKTPYDTFVAYQFMTVAYQGQGNRAGMMKAMQGQLDSGHPSPAEQNQIIKNMATIAYELKDYGQVVELGNRLIRSGAADDGMYGMVGHAMFLQGKHAEVSKFLGDHVADQERRGQKPREPTLTTLRAAQERQGNSAGVSQTLEKLVRHYPKADYWSLLTYQLSRAQKLTDSQSLHIYRLKMATGTLSRCQDYSDMEEMAVAAGMAGEAQRVIEQGLAAKVCTVKSDEDRLRRHLVTNSNVVAEDKARLPKLEADAKVAKTGELDVAVGAQLFGSGDYAKAAEALSRGIAKGGLKNLADAQLTLGTAQYRANNKAEAIKTFQSIKTNDQVTQRIASLWVLYVR